MKKQIRSIMLVFLVGTLSCAAWAVDAPATGEVAAPAAAPAGLGKLPDFRLLDHLGKSHAAHRYLDASALVLMAAPKEDADLDAHLATFTELAQTYAERHVYFFLVTPSAHPGTLGDRSGGVPVLLDDAQVVLPALGLDHAYECVLATTALWQVQFRGDLIGNGEGGRGLAEALAALDTRNAEPFATAARGPMLDLQPAPQNVSYTRDIVPILTSKCAGCHSEGNIAPFSMDSHRKVTGWADMMAETVRGGRMPPWQADPGFGHFSNAMELNVQEKRLLLAWLDNGAPKDGEADPLESFKAPNPRGWRLGQPDLVVKLPEPQEIPAEGVLEYRYYEMPLDLPAGTWVKGTEIRVSQPQVMHHVLVYMRRPGESIDFTQEYIASYVPGHDPGFFPKDTGKPVPPDATLLFQLHYTTNGKAVVDTPELGIYLHKEPPAHEIFLGSAVNRDFYVPAFEPDVEADATFTAHSDILIYSLSPHMHYRGSRMYFEAFYPDGAREVLLSVPDYDFYWQHSYHLAQPKRVPAGTTIRVAGAFDNSVRNPINPDPSQRLSWGDQSTDEMFIGSVLYRQVD